MATGKQTNNQGYKDSEAYKADPDNTRVPDSSYQEYEIGKTSFILSDAQDLLLDVGVAQDTADTALQNAANADANAAAAQATADTAEANAQTAQATADAIIPTVATAQAAADQAQLNANQSLYGFTTVPTIADRDALTPALNEVIAVTDSGDGTPKVYQWNGSAWVDTTSSFVTYSALNVSKNAELIAVNADNIAVNAESIATLADQVATNAELIANNADQNANTAIVTADTADVAAANAVSIATIAQNAVDGINASIGVAGGIASLDGAGLVPSNQLPSYVDDVLEYANLAAFPVTGETSKIYVALDNNRTYRWSGTVYVEISPSDVLSVNGQTGTVTLGKTEIGLPNVDDTSDANKPVSSAQQTALNLKADITALNLKADITALNLKADKTNVLELNNTTVFVPDADYEPATKKYVDDNSGGGGVLSWVRADQTVISGATKTVVFDGAFFWAFKEGTATTTVYKSTDGVSWTPISTTMAGLFVSAYVSDGDLFVLSGTNVYFKVNDSVWANIMDVSDQYLPTTVYATRIDANNHTVFVGGGASTAPIRMKVGGAATQSVGDNIGSTFNAERIVFWNGYYWALNSLVAGTVDLYRSVDGVQFINAGWAFPQTYRHIVIIGENMWLTNTAHSTVLVYYPDDSWEEVDIGVSLYGALQLTNGSLVAVSTTNHLYLGDQLTDLVRWRGIKNVSSASSVNCIAEGNGVVAVLGFNSSAVGN